MTRVRVIGRLFGLSCPGSSLRRVTWTADEEVSALWAEHLELAFPDALRWLDAPSGESVAALDCYIAGCISAYLQGRALDAEHRSAVNGLLSDLRGVIPRLRGAGAEYVVRLLRMAELIAAAPR
jgi:hypothetical protein